MMRTTTVAIACASIMVSPLAAIAADATHGTFGEGPGLAVYQSDVVYVRDPRQVDVPHGDGTVRLGNLPASLRADTLSVDSPDTGAAIRDIVWSPAPASRDQLLRRWIGHRVVLAPRAGVSASEREGMLVAIDGAVPVVRVDGHLEFGGPQAPWRLLLPAEGGRIPFGRPLALGFQSGDGQPHTLALEYLAGGIGWDAGYTLALNGDSAHLTGYATVRNRTEVTYRNARLELVAGDIDDHATSPERVSAMMARADASFAPAPERAGAWYAYPLTRPVVLEADSVRRVALLDRADLPVTRGFRVDGGGAGPVATEASDGMPVPVNVVLTVATGGPKQAPMPGGTVRVLEARDEGIPRFLGSAAIDHTAAGEPVAIRLGSAFDVTCRRRQTDYRRLDDRRHEVGWAITLRNGGDTPANVVVSERLDGDWVLLEQEDAWTRSDARTIRQRLTVPPGGDRTVRYRARITR